MMKKEKDYRLGCVARVYENNELKYQGILVNITKLDNFPQIYELRDKDDLTVLTDSITLDIRLEPPHDKRAPQWVEVLESPYQHSKVKARVGVCYLPYEEEQTLYDRITGVMLYYVEEDIQSGSVFAEGGSIQCRKGELLGSSISFWVGDDIEVLIENYP